MSPLRKNVGHRRASTALVFLALASTAARGQNRDDPEAERASFKVADGFEVSLFASEKDGVVKPIQMRFDARGRLWVAGSAVYPLIVPGEKPHDRILIIEDTDGDGRCDRTTVFADGLMIPTGLEVTGDGNGCYVGHGPELLFLRDSNGDGRADERHVVLRGFGTGDNHQNINSFRWGPGGELWFCQGLHIHSRVETPWGLEKLDQAGIWRLRPRRLKLDGFYGSAAEPQNPWGFVFTRWGEPIELAGNNHSIIYPVPGLVKDDRPAQPALIWSTGRSRKMSGGEIVETAHFPDEWQGRLIIGGYLNNAVWTLTIRDDGSGFALEDAPPLITSNHGSFRPVDVRFGPDGALYLCDWFNPIIGHYQASFRHPDRDKSHGRIWRVTAKGRALTMPLPLIDAPVAELISLLQSGDAWTREFAKRVLTDRPTADVIPAVESASSASIAAQSAHFLKELSGVLQSHDAAEAALPLLEQLGKSSDAGARAYAAAAIGPWADRIPKALEFLRPLAKDDHPRVRLHAVVACTYVSRPEAIEVALTAADFPTDKFLDYAIDQAVHSLRPHWLPEFRAGRLAFPGNPHRLIRLVRGDGAAGTIETARELARDAALDRRARESLWMLVVEAGNADDLVAAMTQPDGQMVERLLSAITRTVRTRGVNPGPRAESLLRPLLDSPSAAVRDEALRLAGLWKVEAFRAVLIDHSRTAAGIEGLVALDALVAARQAAAHLADVRETSATDSILPAFFHRVGGPEALMTALRASPPARACAVSALRVMNERGFQHAEMHGLFSEASNSAAVSQPFPPEAAVELAKEALRQGNSERGARIFRRAELACAACHVRSAARAARSGRRSIQSAPPSRPISSSVPCSLRRRKSRRATRRSNWR